jgi:hypothetical protein
MVYVGGLLGIRELSVEAQKVIALLRIALKNVPEEHPYRGPIFHEKSPYIYQNDIRGKLVRFSGKEIIKKDDEVLYTLQYLGGMID